MPNEELFKDTTPPTSEGMPRSFPDEAGLTGATSGEDLYAGSEPEPAIDLDEEQDPLQVAPVRNFGNLANPSVVPAQPPSASFPEPPNYSHPDYQALKAQQKDELRQLDEEQQADPDADMHQTRREFAEQHGIERQDLARRLGIRRARFPDDLNMEPTPNRMNPQGSRGYSTYADRDAAAERAHLRFDEDINGIRAQLRDPNVPDAQKIQLQGRLNKILADRQKAVEEVMNTPLRPGRPPLKNLTSQAQELGRNPNDPFDQLIGAGGQLIEDTGRGFNPDQPLAHAESLLPTGEDVRQWPQRVRQSRVGKWASEKASQLGNWIRGKFAPPEEERELEDMPDRILTGQRKDYDRFLQGHVGQAPQERDAEIRNYHRRDVPIMISAMEDIASRPDLFSPEEVEAARGMLPSLYNRMDENTPSNLLDTNGQWNMMPPEHRQRHLRDLENMRYEAIAEGAFDNERSPFDYDELSAAVHEGRRRLYGEDAYDDRHLDAQVRGPHQAPAWSPYQAQEMPEWAQRSREVPEHLLDQSKNAKYRTPSKYIPGGLRQEEGLANQRKLERDLETDNLELGLQGNVTDKVRQLTDAGLEDRIDRAQEEAQYLTQDIIPRIAERDAYGRIARRADFQDLDQPEQNRIEAILDSEPDYMDQLAGLNPAMLNRNMELDTPEYQQMRENAKSRIRRDYGHEAQIGKSVYNRRHPDMAKVNSDRYYLDTHLQGDTRNPEKYARRVQREQDRQADAAMMDPDDRWTQVDLPYNIDYPQQEIWARNRQRANYEIGGMMARTRKSYRKLSNPNYMARLSGDKIARHQRLALNDPTTPGTEAYNRMMMVLNSVDPIKRDRILNEALTAGNKAGITAARESFRKRGIANAR